MIQRVMLRWERDVIIGCDCVPHPLLCAVHVLYMYTVQCTQIVYIAQLHRAEWVV